MGNILSEILGFPLNLIGGIGGSIGKMQYENGIDSKLSRGYAQRNEREGMKGLADILAQDSAATQAATRDRLVDNPNYKFGQSIPNQAQSLNDLLIKPSFSAPTQQEQPSFSLMPKTETPIPQESAVNYAKGQPMQAMDFNKMSGLIAKGTGLGLDYGTAAKMVGNYKGMYDDQYNKQTEQRNWDDFNSLKTPQEKLMYAAKNKMPMESIKLLMAPRSETKMVDLGGTKRLIAKNLDTNTYTDVLTGKPITADDLKETMTEYQKKSLEDANYRHNTPSASTVYAANNRVGRGDGSGGSRKSDLAAIDKEIGFLQSQLKTHSAQERYDIGQKYMYERPVFGYRQRNQEKATQIQQQIDELMITRQQIRNGGVSQQPATPPVSSGSVADSASYDQIMSDAISSGKMTPEQAKQIREQDGMPNDSSFWG